MTAVSVVIVNWNAGQLLLDCLASLHGALAGVDSEIVVVDNASADTSLEDAIRVNPNLRVIRNTENVGFATAVNQALEVARGQAIFLLNPDTIVQPDAVRILLDRLTTTPSVGGVGPKVVHPEGRLRILSAGAQPSLRSMAAHYLFLTTLIPRLSPRGLHLLSGRDDGQIEKVEWISGAAFLIRREVYRQVGGLPTRWFMYGEDMEWSQRITDSGWQLEHVPDAVVSHHLSATADLNPLVQTMWLDHMRTWFKERTNAGLVGVAAFNTIMFVGMSVRSVLYAVKGLRSTNGNHDWSSEARKFRIYARASLRRWR